MWSLYIEKTKAQIDAQRCVGCGACISRCPVQAIHMLPGWFCRVDPSTCVGCGACVTLCHKKAPSLVSRNTP